MSILAPTLQAFFTDRLARQRQASGHTIAAYRDAIKLLLAFTAEQTGKPPSRLDIADSTRCSATPRCATPKTPRSSPGCWPSRPSASTRP